MVELENLSAKAGQFRVRGISMKVEKGKFHVLLGPTGSGKTLLLEIIAGLHPPSEGLVRIKGEDATRLPPEQRGISYLPQDNALFPHFDVYGNIAYGLKLRKDKYGPEQINQKIEEIAAALGIAHLLRRKIGKLSGGERQRVALARALVLDNKLLLLDEPTSALHEALQEEFFLMLKEVSKKFGLTVLMATHHRDSAFMLADELHFLWEGELALSAATETIFRIPLPRTVAAYLGFDNFLRLTPAVPGRFHCAQLGADFDFPGLPRDGGELSVAVRPIDIRVLKEEDLDKGIGNTFPVVVKSVLYKLNDAIVLLEHPRTGFALKMQIGVYNQLKMRIFEGAELVCKVKEGAVREVCG
jgi:molybdate/tungstate transport system ATP-binding protein